MAFSLHELMQHVGSYHSYESNSSHIYPTWELSTSICAKSCPLILEDHSYSLSSHPDPASREWPYSFVNGNLKSYLCCSRWYLVCNPTYSYIEAPFVLGRKGVQSPPNEMRSNIRSSWCVRIFLYIWMQYILRNRSLNMYINHVNGVNVPILIFAG